MTDSKGRHGASKIVEYEKKEGSFNRVFNLDMDNGVQIVARIPFRILGPRRLATNSEVATMAYLRSHSTIPVPKVLDWNDDETNAVGTEYIIMEHAPGVQLHERWPSMSTQQHMLCVQSLSMMIQEMANLSFSAYGSLYFADAPFDPLFKIDLIPGFCIGPHCGVPVWPCSPLELALYDERMSKRGPWKDLDAYCSGLLESGYLRTPKADSVSKEPEFRGSVHEHLRLLKICEEVIKDLIASPIIKNISAPTILHPDLHKRNIYVSDDDPTTITALIDWQSTSIDPVFAYANETPYLILPSTDLPTPLKRVERPFTKEQDLEQRTLEKDLAICQQTYDAILRGYIPKLREARYTDELLLRVFRYCSILWRDSATALRQVLIELSQLWNELGLTGSCPYQPTPTELERHKKQYEDFEAYMQTKDSLVRAFNSNSEGWVPPEAYESSKEAHKELFETWMQTCSKDDDPDMTEEKAKKLWPFDVP